MDNQKTDKRSDESILDRVFEKLLESSNKFKQFKKEFEELFHSVGNMAETVLNLSKLVQTHHQSLADLYEIQDRLLKQLSDRGSENQFPLKQKKENNKLN